MIPDNPSARKFDELLQNISAAPGNDDEIDTLKELAMALFNQLTPKQQAHALVDDAVWTIRFRAAEWAAAFERELEQLDPEGRR